jgi:PHD/YefM family antitoxin component YafN of YafNO toxin-antitoxin module
MAILMVLDDIPRREITITRHGRPVAVIVRPDVLRSRSHASDLIEQAERLNEMLREAEKMPLSGKGISAEYAAIAMGATRFITNNSEGFGPFIKEMEVTYPAALPGPETLD